MQSRSKTRKEEINKINKSMNKNAKNTEKKEEKLAKAEARTTIMCGRIVA